MILSLAMLSHDFLFALMIHILTWFSAQQGIILVQKRREKLG
jgi:hypothetical protein